MEVTYHGVHAEVEVPRVGITAKRGATVTVPDSVGASLVEQESWRLAGESEKNAAKRRAADVEPDDVVPVAAEPIEEDK